MLLMLPLFLLFFALFAAAFAAWLGIKWCFAKLRNHHRTRLAVVCVAIGMVATLAPDAALAEINEDNLIDQIIDQYRNNVAQWTGPITTAATWMFWMLALIEFTWTGMLLALRGADYGEVVTEFIVRVLFIGFFAALLAFGPTWAQAIIHSLSDIAGQASIAAGAPGNTSAADIFDTGLELASRMIDDISFWDGAGDALGLIIGAMIVIICFALITAMLILTMVETYIVVQAAVILLGFGPTRWTKDYAIRYLVYAGATGMKWFVLLLVVGLGEALMVQWLNAYENNDTQVLLVIGGAVVLLALVKSLPDMIQSVLTGVSVGTGQSMVAATQQTVNTTAMSSAAVSRIGSGLAGVGRATVGATQLAQAQGRSGLGIISGAAGNLARSAAGEMGQAAARGRYAGPTSGMGHRMTDEMKAKIAALKSDGSIQRGTS